MHTIVLALLILSAVDILIALEIETRNITEGETFELKCTTHLQYPVVWHFRQSDGTHEIFMGGEISMAFKDMFRLTGDHSLGEYNLLIPSADGRYAGNYKCIDDEGLGSELLSIQLNIIASASTTDMAKITEYAPDAANYVVPQAAASSSENHMHSNSIIIPAVVCTVAIGIAIIIVVALRKWHPKCKGKQRESFPKDPESQPPSPDSQETDSFVKKPPPLMSQLSTAPLLDGEKEKI